MFCSSLDTRTLKLIVQESASMSETDRLLYLDLITEVVRSISDDTHTEKVMRRQLASLCAAVAPFLHLVSYSGENSLQVVSLLRRNYTFDAIGKMQNSTPTTLLEPIIRLMLGDYRALNESVRNRAGGLFLNEALDGAIPVKDAEWFAQNWEAVSGVWHLLQAEQVFTRDYAETLINGVGEHGPMLADGML
jgi:hypothetical protein